MSALILQFPAPAQCPQHDGTLHGEMDVLSRQISDRAIEILARRQLGLPLDFQHGSTQLDRETQRIAESIADRAERNGCTVETRRSVERVKARLLNKGESIVRFPKARILRTKTRQREIQRAYKHTASQEAPSERFHRAEFAVQFAEDFERRHGQ